MNSLGVLKKIVSAAALAGLLAGLLLTGVQEWQVSPIILKAEVYEDAAAMATASSQNSHSHSATETEHQDHHEHSAETWQPANGWERTLFTA